MKRKTTLLKLAILTSVFAIGVGFAVNTKPTFTKVEAAQFLDDFDPYTYSGNYYDGFDFTASQGMNGDLRKSLGRLIRPEGYYSYSGTGSTTISHVLQSADEDPNNHNNMIYLYTRDSVTKNAASSWNREHVWPQSLSNGNWGKSEGGTDLLHLRPTYQSTNSSRGNKPYGDNNKQGTNTYNGMVYGYSKDSTYFEPLDQVKGDVARTIMYLWTTYTDYKSYSPLNILRVFQSYDLLLKWHTMDKPDEIEGHRNDYCQTTKQKNRNPFVDYPELAWKIFGEQVSTSIKNACMTAYPDGGSVGPVGPIEPTGIALDKTSASINVDDTLQLTGTLKPYGATGTVTWSSNNTNVATVSNSGLVTAVAEGTAKISAKVNDDIKAECLLTVEDSGGTIGGEGELVIATSISYGDVVVLTAHSDSVQYNGSSSTSTIYGLGLEYTEVPSLENGVSFTVEEGYSDDTYAFKLNSGNNEGKYLSWFTGNSLTTNDDIDENSSWNVSFTSDGDATISNAYDSSRRIMWNHSSPRFAAYGSTYTGRGVQLWKVNQTVTYDLNQYLNYVFSVATIHGTEHTTTEGGSASAIMSEQGYENAEDVSLINLGPVAMTFSKGTGTYHPKYYNGGASVRVYGHNVVTFESTNPITKIIFTYGEAYNDQFYISSGDFDGAVWTGNATSISFTNENNSGHAKIASVTVFYGTTTLESVDEVALRFGAALSKNTWDIFDSQWGIDDYGVMLVKENTLVNTYGLDSIQEAFDEEKTLAIVSNGSGSAPYLENGTYSFRVKVNVSNLDTVFCAAAYMVIGGEYYIFSEMRYSARTLAAECLEYGGSDLSNEALTLLAGNTNE